MQELNLIKMKLMCIYQQKNGEVVKDSDSFKQDDPSKNQVGHASYASLPSCTILGTSSCLGAPLR
jgi:hypothetical protein